MGLKAFTPDGVIRAGFGYAGTFSSSYCRRFFPVIYRLSGLNVYSSPSKTNLLFALNGTIFTHPWLVATPFLCLEWTNNRNYLFWQKPLNELNPQVFSGGMLIPLSFHYVHEPYLGYPAQTWFLSYTLTNAVYILASKQGAPYSPPRSGYTLSNNCSGDLIVR